MIAVDPSALLAMIRDEPQRNAIEAFLRGPGHELIISTASFVEAFVSAERRLEGGGGGYAMQALCQELRINPVPFDTTQMAWATEGFSRFGKGRSREPAVLNFGDCFSYGLAKARAAPLLFVGDDFGKTDVAVALPLQTPREP
jgi:ribonuclease VapC